jgi:uncharacterized membrane protein
MEWLLWSLPYDDLGRVMDLPGLRAIRWLQENVQGSPVIVEGNMVDTIGGAQHDYTDCQMWLAGTGTSASSAITVENLIETGSPR